MGARARLFSGRLANLAAAALGAQAFVIGRRIFLSRDAARAVANGAPGAQALLAHELKHVEQYGRYGIARFLILYLSDYFAGRARGHSHAEAYAAIAFEREAQECAAAPVSPEGFPGGLPRGA